MLLLVLNAMHQRRPRQHLRNGVTASFDPTTGIVPPETVVHRMSHSIVKRPHSTVRGIFRYRHIRAILPQLGPALEAFESQKIHLSVKRPATST